MKSPLDARPIIREHGRQSFNECGVECWLLELTPAIAEQLEMCRDPYQRHVSVSGINRWKGAMEQGLWRPFVDAIWVNSEDGAVFNAQHRISAVRASGTTQWFQVMIAAKRDFLSAIDQGRKRGIADGVRMTLRTERINKSVAAAIQRVHFDFDEGRMTAAAAETRIQVVAECPFMDDLSEIHNIRKVRLNAGVLGAALMAMSIDRDLSRDFFSAIAQNQHMVRGEHSSQVQAITTWLIGITSKGGTMRGGHALIRESVVRCLNAWNAYRGGRKMTHSKYSPAYSIPKPI